MDEADLVLVGASVITVDPGRPRTEAIAVADGRIMAVGTREQVEALRGRGTSTIELDGGVVLPGFQDAHNHACFAGRYMLTCDLHDLHTRDEYLTAIADYAAAHLPDSCRPRRPICS